MVEAAEWHDPPGDPAVGECPGHRRAHRRAGAECHDPPAGPAAARGCPGRKRDPKDGPAAAAWRGPRRARAAATDRILRGAIGPAGLVEIGPASLAGTGLAAWVAIVPQSAAAIAQVWRAAIGLPLFLAGLAGIDLVCRVVTVPASAT